MTDMLMVTTTVGMLDGVHGHTTHLRPRVALHLVLVIGTARLQDRLVDTATAGNDADHGAVRRGQHLLGAGRQLDAGLLRVRIVRDHGGIVARGARQLAAVAGPLLNIANDRTFGHRSDGHHVSDLQIRLPAAVHELAGVHALGRNHQLLAHLVPVRVSEVDHSQWSATAGIVDDVLQCKMCCGRLITDQG